MSEQEKEKQITPFEFLQGFSDSPSKNQVEEWKAQAPGHRIRLFHSADGKRVYLLRGIGAQELGQLQASIPQNIAPEKLGDEVQRRAVTKCCVWTSDTLDHKLTDLYLAGAGAGLAQTLHEVVCQLSDYMDPVDINRYSADL